ncbi:hypothetical protein L596_010184 [Steinernema carpocapsae]|uniref:F-box domain-containing protein n=1 Tax=Steinernema carpocapsae TaxID=34508 RepID=A0A4U5PIC4_STECR|nr:hypothetical protein L596_010184 [Steinernema carpocapsae]
MNSVPFEFIDEVLHLLPKSALTRMTSMHDLFDEFAQNHINKRVNVKCFVGTRKTELIFCHPLTDNFNLDRRYFRLLKITVFNGIPFTNNESFRFLKSQQFCVRELHLCFHVKVNVHNSEFEPLWKVYSNHVKANYSKNKIVVAWHLAKNLNLKSMYVEFESKKDREEFVELWRKSPIIHDLNVIVSAGLSHAYAFSQLQSERKTRVFKEKDFVLKIVSKL